MGTNDAGNWERRLKGEMIPLTTDMEPDYGFYRVPTKDRTSWRAIAYWYDEGGNVVCLIDGRDLDAERARAIWPASSKSPITHELYNAVVKEGQPWPDMNPVVTQSNQAPDDNSFEAIQERIDDLAREAERLMKVGAATTQDQADQAANVATKLAEYGTKADNVRKVEKQPSLDASRAVDAKWSPLITAAEIHKRLKQVVCAPWLAAQQREKERREAEARQIAEEAREAARKAEEEAKRKADEAARTGDMAAIAEAGLQTARAEETAQRAASAVQTVQAIASATVTAGTTGRRGVHLRDEPEYEIEDRAKIFAFFDSQEATKAQLTELLLKMAKAAHRAKITVPGLKVSQGSKAA